MIDYQVIDYTGARDQCIGYFNSMVTERAKDYAWNIRLPGGRSLIAGVRDTLEIFQLDARPEIRNFAKSIAVIVRKILSFYQDAAYIADPEPGQLTAVYPPYIDELIAVDVLFVELAATA